MDTNPILDVDFPSGKLRLEGTHVHTRQKFITIEPKGKKMRALDVFDHMVVFSKQKVGPTLTSAHKVATLILVAATLSTLILTIDACLTNFFAVDRAWPG